MTREYKRDKKSVKEGGGSPSYEISAGDGVDGGYSILNGKVCNS